ncbi:MAG: IgGFc-binding protein [Deltaproteobacteria bacterium]|nr:IgGFc-binding protein [Deltaproteobacteria bacterium]
MKSARFLLPASVALGIIVACGSDKRDGFDTDTSGNGAFDEAGALGEGGAEGGQRPVRDPATCAEAESSKTYVGCDYWPTVTANLVQDAFDFAVAVANVSESPANIKVTGPNGVNQTLTVKPGSLGKVFLPWVPELKGNTLTGITASVIAKKSAYHLVSDVPVVVYQFNPLEFRAVGGPPGKDWSKCQKLSLTAPDCYSYSNDASLLLPSTAMTGSYRIMGSYGFSRHPYDENGVMNKSGPPQPGASPYFVVTATTDGTTVKVALGPKGKVVAGGGINAAPPGGLLTFTLDAGDVAEVVSGMGRDFDFSGSLLSADKPVQVITGVPCIDFPLDITACDHVEETVFPAQTLGKHYVVATPTGPKENKVGHVVRFFGNVDGTVLKYLPSQPSGCPSSLNAAEVVECETTADFEVTANHELGVATFMLGAEMVDPDKSQQQPQGDPSQSFAVAVEQYRLKYIFLAPTDYKTSYVDVIAPPGTNLDLDGTDVSPKLSPIAGTGYVLGRLRLSNAGDGVHKITASKPVGIQVMGYGDNTTYMYPGGLNLGEIAAIPPK